MRKKDEVRMRNQRRSHCGGKEKSVSIGSCLIPAVGTKWSKEASPKADFTPLLPGGCDPVPQVWAEGSFMSIHLMEGWKSISPAVREEGAFPDMELGFCLVRGFCWWLFSWGFF